MEDQLREKGFAVVPDLFTEAECREMKSAMAELIDGTDASALPRSVFSTDDDQQARDEYFLESTDKIRFFFEADALDPQTGQLVVAKDQAFNKAGHALHLLEPTFRRYTFSERVRDIFRTLHFERPLIVQSMYIFKNGRVGGAVHRHTDATFLHASPADRLLGCWIALDDSTAENGCLCFAVGSHKDRTVDYRFVRTGRADRLLEFRGPKPDYAELVSEPVPVKAGSLVLIDGLVVHESAPNRSSVPRHAYTFHVLDGAHAEWSETNWCQPSEHFRFPDLFAQHST